MNPPNTLPLPGFETPDTIYRPAPFWAINDRITPEETARQMEDLLRAGFSGGFFHSRHGLVTKYLGTEWFAAMKAALETAGHKNGYVWLYDEDLWPSGNAGGQVAGMRDEYRAACLEPEFVPRDAQPLPDGEDQPRAAYRISGRHGARAERIERIAIEEAYRSTGCERVLFRRCFRPKTPWWGGESYANLLHPEAVQEFLRLTHKVYKDRLGKAFGTRIPGIFTDEPQICQTSQALAWWDGIPGVYHAWHGRDFWADLPYLYFEGAAARRIRLLIHRTYLRQFCEAFDRPIFEWCERNHLQYTGHYNAEDGFERQIRSHGGGVMAHYRYQHIPGIDHLGRQIRGMLLTCKQATSAARQLGRPRVLTELFGATWHTNAFEDFKWLGDHDLALGANFFCPHLALYSVKGRRKRDYPPNWNYQQTYWDDLRPLNDYFARVSYALSQGRAKPAVLILHPIESAAAARRLGLRAQKPQDPVRALPGDLPDEDFRAARKLEVLLLRALEASLHAGYDTDLGDEGYLADLGSVAGNLFRVGAMAYPVVVLPPAPTWRPRTYDLLMRFAAGGGKLLLLGALPEELDGERAAGKWKALADTPGVLSLPCGTRRIQAVLDRICDTGYRLRGTNGEAPTNLYLQHRVDGDQEIFFIVNEDRDRPLNLEFNRFGPDGPMARLNPLDGTRTRLQPRKVDGSLRLDLALPPMGSVLLLLGPGAGAGTAKCDRSARLPPGEVKTLPGPWRFRRTEENVLVMDRISASLDGGKTWWDEDLEFRVRRRLAEHFGTAEALPWQPWVALRKGIFKERGGPVVLRYLFRSAMDRPRSAHLVIEDLARGKATVNGVLLDTTASAWHFDRTFGKTDITGLVRKGVNIVDFHIQYNLLSEIESAYIVGDFGVRLADPCRGEIVAEPVTLQAGSWIDQGYPFYSGRMLYRMDFTYRGAGRVFLRLKHPSGILYKLRVNGAEAGRILWRPYERDLTPYLRNGTNELEIEVVSSRQNTFGPLHEREGDDFRWIGPSTFEDEQFIREGFSLFDYGLLEGAELITL